MTDNEKAIRKANAQFGEEFLSSKKQEWLAIRKDHRIDRDNAILDLVKAGVDILEASAIIDREIKEEEDTFKFIAVNEIRRQKRALEKELKVKTHKNSL